ncbi:hypothetical protein GYMLUDRAFT_48948 [Collybiopsis luxurians FD-317 M1]|uniref:Uncharacterized protein n=1 Tax=Collybiopsis luxurians FD-317 M1 TaxID=944289 RepID=A0A0D0CGR1_9AGAR|nr:hypothetical protein GYMLUDRAFT_48948 [Collybiopsis luxurians FD-317 M1]
MKAGDDLTIASRMGSVMKDMIIGTITAAILFGIYLGASGVAIWFVVRKGVRSRPQRIALSVQFCLLVNCICSFLSTCAVPLMEIQEVLMDSSTSHSLQDRIATFSESIVLGHFLSVVAWSSSINILIGDTLLIWRAWAIWRGNMFVEWIWIMLGICNTVFTVIAVTSRTPRGTGSNFGIAFKLNFYLLLSLSLNVLATAAIAYKAWIHSKRTNAFGREYKSDPDSSRVDKVLWFVVEAGVAFGILQIAYYAISMVASLSTIQSAVIELYSTVIQPLGVMILPFYPTTVFVISNFIA